MIISKSGDIFSSNAEVICHQVNCQGVMGKGLALQVKTKYPEVFIAYKEKCKLIKQGVIKGLGDAQFCSVRGRIIVNLFAQYRYGTDQRHTDYDALRKALTSVKEAFPSSTIAIPYEIGCRLAGGDWSVVYTIIGEVFCEKENRVEIWKKDRDV